MTSGVECRRGAYLHGTGLLPRNLVGAGCRWNWDSGSAGLEPSALLGVQGSEAAWWSPQFPPLGTGVGLGFHMSEA